MCIRDSPHRAHARAARSRAPRALTRRAPCVGQVSLRSNADKLGAGVQFYVRGVRLLAQDAWFSLGLLSQAVSGQTLSEREARILQRTARDLLTFIPFVIILIIPLSPPGCAPARRECLRGAARDMPHASRARLRARTGAGTCSSSR